MYVYICSSRADTVSREGNCLTLPTCRDTSKAYAYCGCLRASETIFS